MDVSIYFIFFFWSGRGNGESKVRGVGSVFKLKVPRGGVSMTGGAEGPGGCLQHIGEFFLGGGGQIFFFRGRNVHQGNLLKLRSPLVHFPKR